MSHTGIMFNIAKTGCFLTLIMSDIGIMFDIIPYFLRNSRDFC